jgi:hypothetical protein
MVIVRQKIVKIHFARIFKSPFFAFGITVVINIARQFVYYNLL